MCEGLLVNKMWDGFLKRKMEREMRKAADIEDAFQRIKAATVSALANLFPGTHRRHRYRA